MGESHTPRALTGTRRAVTARANRPKAIAPRRAMAMAMAGHGGTPANRTGRRAPRARRAPRRRAPRPRPTAGAQVAGGITRAALSTRTGAVAARVARTPAVDPTAPVDTARPTATQGTPAAPTAPT